MIKQSKEELLHQLNTAQTKILNLKKLNKRLREEKKQLEKDHEEVVAEMQQEYDDLIDEYNESASYAVQDY